VLVRYTAPTMGPHQTIVWFVHEEATPPRAPAKHSGNQCAAHNAPSADRKKRALFPLSIVYMMPTVGAHTRRALRRGRGCGHAAGWRTQAACRALYPNECNGVTVATTVLVDGESLVYDVELYCPCTDPAAAAGVTPSTPNPTAGTGVTPTPAAATPTAGAGPTPTAGTVVTPTPAAATPTAGPTPTAGTGVTPTTAGASPTPTAAAESTGATPAPTGGELTGLTAGLTNAAGGSPGTRVLLALMAAAMVHLLC